MKNNRCPACHRPMAQDIPARIAFLESQIPIVEERAVKAQDKSKHAQSTKLAWAKYYDLRDEYYDLTGELWGVFAGRKYTPGQPSVKWEG